MRGCMLNTPLAVGTLIRWRQQRKCTTESDPRVSKRCITSSYIYCRQFCFVLCRFVVFIFISICSYDLVVIMLMLTLYDAFCYKAEPSLGRLLSNICYEHSRRYN